MNFPTLIISSLLSISVMIESKPRENRTIDFKEFNKIDYDEKSSKGNRKKNYQEKLPRQTESSVGEYDDRILQENEKNVNTDEKSGNIRPSPNNDVSSLLLPILQRWQFSTPLFFQDHLNHLRKGLESLGFVVPSKNFTQSKQFATTNGLLQLTGLNDSGFYTDRLGSAGFLGGNGWFANKGGILGGPGALISTGSLLTDYPTPYRK